MHGGLRRCFRQCQLRQVNVCGRENASDLQSATILDAFDCELRRVVRRSDIHGASITLEIIDAVWDCDPICHGAKVVVVDGIAL